MLDIKFVREHPDVVKENIKKKFQDQKLPLVDEVIALDEKIRALKNEGRNLRAERNASSSNGERLDVGNCSITHSPSSLRERSRTVLMQAAI